mgnify:CR=1 FL=1
MLGMLSRVLQKIGWIILAESSWQSAVTSCVEKLPEDMQDVLLTQFPLAGDISLVNVGEICWCNCCSK